MISAARITALSTLLSLASWLPLAMGSGCGGDEPAPIYLGGNNNNRRDSGMDDDDDEPTAGRRGSDAGDEGGSGGRGSAGRNAGEGGSGSGGSMADAGPTEDAGPIELPSSPENPWIAFIQIDGSGFGQLFFVKADGTGLHEYGGDTFSETSAAWSPDGSLLAFTGLADSAELHVLDFEAGTDTVLDTGLAKMSRPRWAANGSAIVVTGGVSPGSTNALFRVDATDGGNEQITESAGGDSGHDLAPDGTLYFVRKLGTAFDIFSVSSAASPSTMVDQVTNGSSVIGGVEVHPDGSRVAYARSSGTTTQLIERTIAGGAERVIGDMGDEEPDYFSGGDFLVVSRDSFDGDSEITVADDDGVLVTRCTDADRFKTNPAVSALESDGIDVTQF
jgi:Tol biopolymer transport system component